MSAVFSQLATSFPTYEQLKTYLSSPEGGSLRIIPCVLTTGSYALIRYVKGESNLSLSHVRAFRSVVWNTETNRPVSVTPFKSMDGEGIPNDSLANYTVEEFLDGTLIGMWYNPNTSQWEIHTRSTPGAKCRFYSPDKTFADMFYEASFGLNFAALDTASSYSFVLQHPGNRIVLPVGRPAIRCVQRAILQPDGSFVYGPIAGLTPPAVRSYPTWTALISDVANPSNQTQGLVIKAADGRRWKVRTPFYNRVHRLRGNNARLDYVYLSLWKAHQLEAYLALFKEEKAGANALLTRFKALTNDVFHTYTDVFKARSLDRNAIPLRIRPFVYGLHGLYKTQTPVGEGRPTIRAIDWAKTRDYMNSRDVPQLLYALNWDQRQARIQSGIPMIPIEPSATVGTEVEVEGQPIVVPVPGPVPEPVPLSESTPENVVQYQAELEAFKEGAESSPTATCSVPVATCDPPVATCDAPAE